MTSTLTCLDCGTSIERNAIGRPRRRCAPCQKGRSHRATVQACSGCGQDMPLGIGRTYCSDACRPRRIDRRVGSGEPRWLSPAAKERQRLYWQEKGRRRRAVKRGSASEPYTLAEIAERDGECCGLCGTAVPMGVRVPDPLAPTIDHVVPISRGGGDTRANVQLAHFRCNSVKGAREIDRVVLAG